MDEIIDIGYLINIGISTCRLFKVHNDESLKEDRVISYGMSPEDTGYFDKLIEIIQMIILDQELGCICVANWAAMGLIREGN